MAQINFKYIKFKNFMSYGNKLTEIIFDDSHSLISGKNGHGKSTIFMALFYALYGKTYKKLKLASLINNINNKDMYTEIGFEINGNDYLIKRGQKPSIFEIYEDGKLIEQSASTGDYQEYLETHILKIPDHVFKQLIFFGANVIGNKTFLEMSKAEKDDMFGIITDTSVFSVIRETINTKLKEAKTKLTDLTYRLGLLEQSIKSESENIRKLEEHNQKAKAFKETLAQSAETDIEALQSELNKNKEDFEKLSTFKPKYDTLTQMITEVLSQIASKTSELNTVKQELSVIEMTKKTFSVCIGCDKLKEVSKGDITKEPELMSVRESLEEEIKSLTETQEGYTSKLNILKEKLMGGKFIKEKISSLEESISKEISRRSSMGEEIQEIEIDYSILEKHKAEYSKYSKGKEHLTQKSEKYAKLYKLMDNNNLKGVILNQQIPALNRYINQYLSEFSSGFDFKFFLDQNFKETVMNKNKEVEINSLSNGYSLRVTFSIMFAFLKLVQERSGVSTNLLILDEALDGSIDGEGRAELLRIIKNDFRDKSVFIISHNPDIKDNIQDFDKTYVVTNSNGFSSIEEV